MNTVPCSAHVQKGVGGEGARETPPLPGHWHGRQNHSLTVFIQAAPQGPHMATYPHVFTTGAKRVLPASLREENIADNTPAGQEGTPPPRIS